MIGGAMPINILRMFPQKPKRLFQGILCTGVEWCSAFVVLAVDVGSGFEQAVYRFGLS
jgi:hypothetical protein